MPLLERAGDAAAVLPLLLLRCCRHSEIRGGGGGRGAGGVGAGWRRQQRRATTSTIDARASVTTTKLARREEWKGTTRVTYTGWKGEESMLKEKPNRTGYSDTTRRQTDSESKQQQRRLQQVSKRTLDTCKHKRIEREERPDKQRTA